MSLRFTNVNVRGQDSLSSEDPSVQTVLTHYSNEFMNLHGQAEYAVFKKGDLLSLGGGVQKIGFNLYEGDNNYYRVEMWQILVINSNVFRPIAHHKEIVFPTCL